jgi:hypothetical protein
MKAGGVSFGSLDGIPTGPGYTSILKFGLAFFLSMGSSAFESPSPGL